MDKYEELRKREIEAWIRELEKAQNRDDWPSTGRRIRNHLRTVLHHRGGMGTPKAKKNPAKGKPREDTNQTAFRVMQEVIRRSES